MNNLKGAGIMKKVLGFLVALLGVAGLGVGFAHAGLLPPIDLGQGRALKFFYEAQFGLTYRNMGSGVTGDRDTTDFNFRRNRFGVIGKANRWLGFYVQSEYIEDRVIGPLYVDLSDEDEDFYLIDAQLRFSFYDWLHIYAGKLKHSLTRENLEACFEPLTFDRSLFAYAPFKTSRDYGMLVYGNFYKDIFQYRFDIMEGKESGDLSPESAPRFTFRLHASLLDPETGYGYRGTYMGKKRVLTIGGSYQFEPNPVYADLVNHQGAEDYSAYSFDVFYEQPSRYGTFTASAAYLNVDFEDAYKRINPVTGVRPDSGVIGQNGERHGFYVKGGYMLPQKVGPGRLQFFGRYDKFKFAHYGSDYYYGYDNDIDWYGAGFNYYILGQDLKLTMEYSWTDFEQESSSNRNFRDFETLQCYIQVRF